MKKVYVKSKKDELQIVLTIDYQMAKRLTHLKSFVSNDQHILIVKLG